MSEVCYFLLFFCFLKHTLTCPQIIACAQSLTFQKHRGFALVRSTKEKNYDDDDDYGDRDDTLWIHTPHKKLKQKLMQWSQNIDEQVRASKRQSEWANEQVSGYVCLRNVCLYSLPSARSHKNYRHEFQSAFSNNKLGCLFLYGSFSVTFFFPLSFFPYFFPSAVWVRTRKSLCTRVVCKFYFSFGRVAIIRIQFSRGYFFYNL